jgi:CelD/BcsL family acetyltransferase involved in cellulose biosynthesis
MSPSGIQVVCYRQLSDVDHVIALVCDIEKSTYKKGLEVGFTDSALNRALLEQAARDGWLRAYILYAGGEPCAFQLDVHYGQTQFTEYGSFDPRWRQGSPGIVLLVKVIEQLCGEAQVRAMDYGFGGASYKEKFGTTCWLEKSVYIYAPRVRPLLVNMAMSADMAFCEVLRRATARLQLDSWVKRRWRRMVGASGAKDCAAQRR